MKIPREIKIDSGYYPIQWDRNCFNQDDIHGHTNRDIGLFKLACNPSIPRHVIEQTFLHELIHLLDRSYGVFRIFMKDNSSNNYEYERKVDVLATCIHMVFTENRICYCSGSLYMPKKVKIGGFTYEVDLDKSLYNETKYSSILENFFLKFRMDAGGEVPKEKIESGFLTCIFKAIDYYFHIFEYRSSDYGFTALEVFINGFYQVLKDNPELCFCEGGTLQ
jgi:hypothetical protein